MNSKAISAMNDKIVSRIFNEINTPSEDQIKDTVEIYVPSKYPSSAEIKNYREIVKITMQMLIAMFGGATADDRIGGWKDKSGKVHIEDVVVCKAYTKKIDKNETEKIILYCLNLKEETKQLSFAFVINGSLYSI